MPQEVLEVLLHETEEHRLLGTTRDVRSRKPRHAPPLARRVPASRSCNRGRLGTPTPGPGHFAPVRGHPAALLACALKRF
jgi:hypothetical protein